MAAFDRNFVGDHENLPLFEHFIKVIFPEAIDNRKMMLPEKMAFVFRNKLRDVVKLKGPTGRVWKVGLTRERGSDRKVWLDSGFGDFLRFHSIEAGHLLIFKYQGYSRFKVVICDFTACEVVFPDAEPQPSSGEDNDETNGYEFGSEEDEEEEEEISDSESDESFHLGRNSRSAKGKGKQVETSNRRRGVDPSVSRRKPTGATNRAARTASAGQGNRWNRRHLALEDSDDSGDDDFEVGNGKGKRTPTRDGASGFRRRPNQVNAAERLAKTVSGRRDGDLWSRLVASRIEFSTKFSTSFARLSPGSKRGVEKAIDCNNPINPSLLIVLKNNHINLGIMYMPNKFARKHFVEDSQQAVTLRAYEGATKFLGETFICTARNEPDYKVLYFRGWGEFRTSYELEVGDVCLFELVDKEKMVFEVHIFRA